MKKYFNTIKTVKRFRYYSIAIILLSDVCIQLTAYSAKKEKARQLHLLILALNAYSFSDLLMAKDTT